MSQVDQDESLDFDTESSANLKIPTLRVFGTPYSWLARSRLVTNTMASQFDGDSSCDEAGSSLGDSSYDIIDDRSITTDDEERDQMTESTSSEGFESDQHNTASTSRAHTVENSSLEDSSFDIQTPTFTRGSHINHHSPKWIVAEEALAEVPEEPIQFEEPSVISLNSSRLMEVSYILRTIDEPRQIKGDLENAIKELPEGILNITIRQTMNGQGIELRGNPYKVMVVGDTSMKEPVINKIAAALAADCGSSNAVFDENRPTKFNIVPVSAFGGSGHPDVVLIDSSGLELSVEECIAAGYIKTQENKDTLSLRMADGGLVQSWWLPSKSQYTYSKDWKLPDLAIFCMSDEESPQFCHTKVVARSFMHRYGVPSIVIQKKVSWTASTTLDYLTPHLCLESHQPNGRNTIHKKRYPVDLATFLNIDAGQLNRNLACLAYSKRFRESERGDPTIFNAARENIWYSEIPKRFQEMMTSIFPARAVSMLPLLALLILSVVPLGFLSLAGTLISSTDPATTPFATSMSTGTNSSISIETPKSQTMFTGSVPVVSYIASTSSPKPSSKSLSSNTDIASALMDAYPLRPEKSDEFQIQILGDHHIVVSTPRWMHRSKKVPSLDFEVSRQNKSLECVASNIGEGVYALQIPYEEAYGILDVNITIISKAIEQKMFEVNFGSSWLQKGAWRRATRAVSDAVVEDLSVVQTSLSNVYNRSITELSTFIYQTKGALAAQRKADLAILTSTLKWGVELRDLVSSQTKELSRMMSDRIHHRHQQVTRQVRFLKQVVNHCVLMHTQDRMQRLSLYADHLAQEVIRTKTVHHGLAREYLKTAQKKALKAWWKVVGVPKTSRLPKITENKLSDAQ